MLSTATKACPALSVIGLRLSLDKETSSHIQDPVLPGRLVLFWLPLNFSHANSQSFLIFLAFCHIPPWRNWEDGWRLLARWDPCCQSLDLNLRPEIGKQRAVDREHPELLPPCRWLFPCVFLFAKDLLRLPTSLPNGQTGECRQNRGGQGH